MHVDMSSNKTCEQGENLDPSNAVDTLSLTSEQSLFTAFKGKMILSMLA